MKIQLGQKPLVRAPLLARVAPVFVVALSLLGTGVHASERWATLEAIHQLENPRDLADPGPCGELGPYQFREGTWKKYTMAPFSRALDKHSSDAVAVRHYDWLKAEFVRRGVEVTPYTIALAWNAGIRAVLVANPPAAAVDYATRAANLAAEFESHELAIAR